MQLNLMNAQASQPVGTLRVVKNFRKVIERRDINAMTKELYQFLNLHCGFIAHYDIHGFKAVYSPPKEFAEVFIRHFDSEHRCFSGVYRCHEEEYEGTGFTKAEIKREFLRIVDMHKDAISSWAGSKKRNKRYELYIVLKNEFEPE